MFKNISRKTTNIVDNHSEHHRQQQHQQQQQQQQQQHYNQDQLLAMIHRLMNERDLLWRENEYLKAKLNESLQNETINEMKRERDLLLKLLVNLTMKDQGSQSYPDEHSSSHQAYLSDDNNNSYSNDLLPPAPYQTYNNSTPNGKSMHRNSPKSYSRSHHSRHSHPPVPPTTTTTATPGTLNHRDVPVQLVETKSTSRRSHRPKSNGHDFQATNQPTVVYRVEGTKESLMNPEELSSVFAHVKHSHPNKKIVVYKTSTTPQTHEFHQLVDEMCVKHGVELKHSQNSPFQQYRSQSLQDLTSTGNGPSVTTTTTPRDFDFQFQPIEKQEPTRMNFSKK